jgi:hypothetical protein
LNFSIILIFGLNNVGFRSFFLHFYAKNPHYNSIPPKKPRNSAYFVPKSAPEQGQVKVADFGVSGELADTVGQAHSWVGTTVWVAVAGGGSGWGVAVVTVAVAAVAVVVVTVAVAVATVAVTVAAVAVTVAAVAGWQWLRWLGGSGSGYSGSGYSGSGYSGSGYSGSGCSGSGSGWVAVAGWQLIFGFLGWGLIGKMGGFDKKIEFF